MRLLTFGIASLSLALAPVAAAQQQDESTGASSTTTQDAQPAAPQEEQARSVAEDAANVLKNSAEAIKKVDTLSYGLDVQPGGAFVQSMPKIEGAAKLVRKETPETSMTSFSGEMTLPEGAPVEDSGRIEFASTGEKAFVVIHPRKEFYEGTIGEGGEQLLGLAELVIMEPLLAETPFDRELNEAETVKLEGTRDVGAAKCDVVYADFGPMNGEIRWYIDRADRLPRGFEHTMTNPYTQEKGTVTLLSSNLTAKETIDPAEFTLTAPEGFKSEVIDMTAQQQLQQPTEQDQAAAEPDTLAVGTAAPAWALETPGGEEVSLASLKGNVVVMDFWATWCPPCKLAMPGMQALHEKYSDKPVKILGINTWESGDAEQYMKDNKLTYPLLLKGDDVAEEYNVSGIPTFYVIGPDGKIIHAFVGYDPEGEETLSKIIDKALADADAAGDGG